MTHAGSEKRTSLTRQYSGRYDPALTLREAVTTELRLLGR
jgi:hypothetical protein